MWSERYGDGRRIALALAIAAIVHGGAIVAVHRTRLEPFELPATGEPPALEIDLEPQPAPGERATSPEPTTNPAQPDTGREPSDDGERPRTAATHGRSRDAAETPPRSPPEDGADERGDTAQESTAHPHGTPGRRIELGIDPQSAWRLTPPPADSGTAHAPPPVPRSRTGGVQELLDARDLDIGLGRSGSMVTAAERAAAGEWAPAEGSVTLEVVAKRDGTISVSVTDANFDQRRWSKIANEMASMLRGRSIRIPDGAAGLRVRLLVTAEQVYIDGRRVSSSGTRLNPTLGAVDSNGRLTALPGIYFSTTGKVCGLAIGLTILGPHLSGGCSPENIGTKPVRAVHTRVLAEERF